MWIDTHCHLNAPEFASNVQVQREHARQAGVAYCVIPAVQTSEFDATISLARHGGDFYALGVHPLYVANEPPQAIERLQDALTKVRNDPRLVAIGEIGLDYFVPELTQEPLRGLQENFCREQLQLARRTGLPVLLHVRRSVDQLLKMLRQIETVGGIAHAFNGSIQQAQQFIELGFKLGFGGACTYARATRLQSLARQLPLHSIVLETDSPDMPPYWLYATAADRAMGIVQKHNTPAQLPQIGAYIADLRGMTANDLAQATKNNAAVALPKLKAYIS
jgi:TatD DNase family protein